MLSTRAVLLAVLICTVASISGANSRRRQVRSPFTPGMQAWIAKAAEEQVQLAAKIGRAMKILPPKAENGTVGNENSTSIARESNPFAFFETIPLKIVSVIKGVKEERNSTVDIEKIEPTTAETTQSTVTIPEKVVVVEVDPVGEVDPVEVLPKPQELKSLGTELSEIVVDGAGSPSTVAAASVPVAAAVETDSVVEESVTGVNETDSVDEDGSVVDETLSDAAESDPVAVKTDVSDPEPESSAVAVSEDAEEEADEEEEEADEEVGEGDGDDEDKPL